MADSKIDRRIVSLIDFINDKRKLTKECEKCGIWLISKGGPDSFDDEQDDGPLIEKVRRQEPMRQRGFLKEISWPSIRILKKVRTSFLKLRKMNIENIKYIIQQNLSISNSVMTIFQATLETTTASTAPKKLKPYGRTYDTPWRSLRVMKREMQDQ